MAKPPLQIAIVTNHREGLIGGRRLRCIAVSPSAHFHILLHNVSSKRLLIWNPGCASGAFALRFELKTPEGRICSLQFHGTFAGGSFYPSAIPIRPGDFVIDRINLAVNWALPAWTRVPGGEGTRRVRMRAVYAPAPENLSDWDHGLAKLQQQLPAIETQIGQQYAEGMLRSKRRFLAYVRGMNRKVWFGRITTRWEDFELWEPLDITQAETP